MSNINFGQRYPMYKNAPNYIVLVRFGWHFQNHTFFEDVDFVIQANVFGMKKPLPGESKVGSVIMQNSNYAVFKLNSHSYGIPEMIPQNERDEAKLRLNQQSGISDYTAFISELQLNAEIETTYN